MGETPLRTGFLVFFLAMYPLVCSAREADRENQPEPTTPGAFSVPEPREDL